MDSHAEKNYEDVTQHDNTLLVGLCSGLFAAAAIASTPSLSALVPVAVQVVLMAFRTGSYVHKIGERLCPAREQSESWTYIFAGMNRDNASEILSKFHEEKVRPQSPGIHSGAAPPCAQRAYSALGQGSGGPMGPLAVEMRIA